MIFGNPDTIAIEVGDVVSFGDRDWVPFRFLIANQPFGNFSDRISLFGCAVRMKSFLMNREYRRNDALEDCDTEQVFAETFTAFYEYDYRTQPIIRPNLRSRYHLNEVALDSTRDSFGIVVVDVNSTESRIVVRDLRTNRFVLDIRIKTQDIENMGTSFIAWAEQKVGRSIEEIDMRW